MPGIFRTCPTLALLATLLVAAPTGAFTLKWKPIDRALLAETKGNAARSMSGGILAFQPSFLPSLVPWFLEERPRHSPVRMDPAKMVDVMEFRIPDGYRIESVPDSGSETTPFGTLRTRFDQTEGSVRYTQEITLQGGVVPLEETGRLKEFLAQALGAGRVYLVAAPR